MKKTNRQIFILCAFLGVTFSLKAWADDPSSQILQEQKDLENMIADSVEVEDFIHKEWDKRNPFDNNDIRNVVQKVPTVAVENKVDLALQGVFLGSSKPSAIINGMVLGVGGQVDNCIVRDINEDRVILDDSKGNKIILSLKQ
jgi:hypothetical protein